MSTSSNGHGNGNAYSNGSANGYQHGGGANGNGGSFEFDLKGDRVRVDIGATYHHRYGGSPMTIDAHVDDDIFSVSFKTRKDRLKRGRHMDQYVLPIVSAKFEVASVAKVKALEDEILQLKSWILHTYEQMRLAGFDQLVPPRFGDNGNDDDDGHDD